MPSGDMLRVGISGLQVFQRTLNTIGHNISNVNTDGYSRQVVDLVPRYPTPSGDGFIGNGVRTSTTKRLFDEHAAEQVRSRSSTTEFFDIYHEFASQVDNLVADPDAGLSPAINAFFDSVQEVADDPSSIPARNVLLTDAEVLVDRFETMQEWFSDLQRAVNDKIFNEVTVVNELASSIADLNKDIIVATGIGGGQPPNDLLDQRDHLVDELSKHLNIRTIEATDGSINVYVGSGQSIVLSTRTMKLDPAQNIDDPTNMEVGYLDPVTGTTASISAMLSGGELGGILKYREEVLMPSVNSLGRVAIGIATVFNTQHNKGMDLTNNLGGDFFSLPYLPAIVAGDPPVAQLFATDGVNNTGASSVTVRLNDIQALTIDEYQLTFDPSGDYILKNLNTNQTDILTIAAAGPPIQFDPIYGMDIELSAVPAVNDKFFIRPNRQAARDIAVAIRDPNLIAAAHPLRTGIDVNNNSGDGAISETTITDYANADLLETVTITFRNSLGLPFPAVADVYDVTGVGIGLPQIGVPYVNADVDGDGIGDGDVLSFNGWDVRITGIPKDGDVFVVDANVNGVSDNRNALALSDLQTTGTMIGGNATFHDAYSELVVLVGNLTHQAEIGYESQSALLDQATQLKDSLSGVNLDEEAANMLAFQQAYAAAAQVIAAADEVFQTLISAVRR